MINTEPIIAQSIIEELHEEFETVIDDDFVNDEQLLQIISNS
jgi:hypothetical protein